MNRTIIAVFAILAGLGLAAPAFAAGEILGGNSHVQLSPLMAPIAPKPGSFMPRTRPLTPILLVPGAGDVAKVCQRAPQVKEAILQYFQAKPAPLLRNDRIDLNALEKDSALIARYVNKRLWPGAVSEVAMVVNAKAMATGVAKRFGFASNCSRVLEEFDKRVKALREGAGLPADGGDAAPKH